MEFQYVFEVIYELSSTRPTKNVAAFSASEAMSKIINLEGTANVTFLSIVRGQHVWA